MKGMIGRKGMKGIKGRKGMKGMKGRKGRKGRKGTVYKLEFLPDFNQNMALADAIVVETTFINWDSYVISSI